MPPLEICLPCECGRHPVISPQDRYFVVMCLDLGGCGIVGRFRPSPNQAVAAWNRLRLATDRARFEAAVGPLDWPDEAITAMVHWIKRLDPGRWASAHADLDQILDAIEANRVSRTQAL